MVSGYMESLEKPQNYQNWWVGSYTGVGACLGQNSSYTETIYWENKLYGYTFFYMWQSQVHVEIEHYSVEYFDCITTFKVL